MWRFEFSDMHLTQYSDVGNLLQKYKLIYKHLIGIYSYNSPCAM